ncbi:MAG: dihydrolipoyl dehydrogenase [Bacilli bacterium]
MEQRNYDLVVLGGGTGGYVAAIAAAQRGMRVAIVESAQLGGTCLHRGCIPSKALLKSAEMYEKMKKSEQFGIDCTAVTYNWNRMFERKRSIVEQLHRGVEMLVKKAGVTVYEGTGTLLGPSIFSPQAGVVSVALGDDEWIALIGRWVLIATGAIPNSLTLADGVTLVASTSDEVTQLHDEPAEVVIVGGGVIGMEWASFYATLGKRATVVERADTILPNEDAEIVRYFIRAMKKRGVKIVTGAKVTAQDTGEKILTFERKGTTEQCTYDLLLLSVGRAPNTLSIGLENTNVELDGGRIVTNEFGQTKESHIYAIGDCTSKRQLAHMAIHSAVVAVSHMAGEDTQPIVAHHIPSVVYSFPQLASIGFTEQQLKEENRAYVIGKVPFSAIGKAHVDAHTDGFVKILIDPETDDLLGAHLIGDTVSEMINEFSFAFMVEAAGSEMGMTVRAHPTLGEAIGEASLAAFERAIHI